MTTAESELVGSRVRIGKQRATVRYLGQVDGQTGVWVGLEWDDPLRGKHDGSFKGKRYFVCRFHPTAGSLLRKERFDETADRGCSMLEAVRHHYCDGMGEGNQSSQHMRAGIELVGLAQAEERQRNIAELAKITLQDSRACWQGPQGELRATLPSLSDLDLSGSIVGSWQVVAALTSELPTLRSLQLSDCRLASRPLPPPFTAPALRILVLNDCLVTWQEVVHVGRCLPALTELHVCRNKLEQLQPPDAPSGSAAHAALASAFPALEVLDLDGNCISDWCQVAALQQLPCLRRLALGGNQLSSIGNTSSAEDTGRAFGSLRTLLLGGNQLASWQAVDQLNSFTTLQDVRVSGNPVLYGLDAVGGRLETVARLASVTILNGSPVHVLERRDAELWYLRVVAGELEAAGPGEEARSAVQARHPRLPALMRKYDVKPAAPAAPGAAAPPSLRASMVSLTLVAGERRVTKRVPGTLTVDKLRLLASKLLRLEVGPATPLALQLPAREGVEEIGGQGARDLALLGVVDEAEVVIGL